MPTSDDIMGDNDDGYSSDEDSFVELPNVNPRTRDLAAEIYVEDPLFNLQIDCVTDLYIGNDGPSMEPPYHFPVLPHQGDWGRTGEYMGKAERLKTLAFGQMEGIPVLSPWVPGVSEENLVALCKGGLHLNKSIKAFSIECGDFLGGRGFMALSSFFERTTTLESMSFIECESAAGSDDFARHLADALSKFSSLKSFESHVNPRIAHKVFESLAGHKELETIGLRADTSLGKKASSALSALLRGKPKIPSITLLCKGGWYFNLNKPIKGCSIECGDVEILGSLSSSLERTTTLEIMSFIECEEAAAIENDDFARRLADALSKFSSLKSFESHVNPRMAHKVLESLAGHKGLDTIHLQSDTSLGKKASSALSALLRGKPKLSSITLELRYDHCNYMFGDREFMHEDVTGMLDDDGMNALSSGLCGKNSVTKLKLIGNQNVSSVGWGSFATLLRSSRSVLQTLSMPVNNISDEAAILIANALSRNKVLREIDLASCRGITSLGWRAFCAVFESEDSALEKMSLWDCLIRRDVYIAWANALANNKRLRVLDTTYCPQHRQDEDTGISSFQRILCNASTIMDTFLSNHTLEKVGSCDRDVVYEFDPLLKINKDNSAFDASRAKIIMHHSHEVLQIFKAMDLDLLPNALAWLGKRSSGSDVRPDEESSSGSSMQHDILDEGSKFSSGSSMLYDFLRAMPGLFEGTNVGGARKRKRE
ncbi:hypothetical protein ACHAXT_002294 [Thalassiosira profunda]